MPVTLEPRQGIAYPRAQPTTREVLAAMGVFESIEELGEACEEARWALTRHLRGDADRAGNAICRMIGAFRQGRAIERARLFGLLCYFGKLEVREHFREGRRRRVVPQNQAGWTVSQLALRMGEKPRCGPIHVFAAVKISGHEAFWTNVLAEGDSVEFNWRPQEVALVVDPTGATSDLNAQIDQTAMEALLDDCLTALPTNERRLIVDWAHDVPQRTISQELKKSEATISRMRRSITSKLKDCIEHKRQSRGGQP